MKLKYTLGALAALTLSTGIAGSAMAQYDEDPGYTAHRRQTLRQYCYNHPYAERCEQYRRAPVRRNRSYESEGSGRCASASTHSAGKAWIPYGMARNSAIKAWEKEVRIDYGTNYANWNHAESKSIECGPSGTGLGQVCEARGRPCR